MALQRSGWKASLDHSAHERGNGAKLTDGLFAMTTWAWADDQVLAENQRDVQHSLERVDEFVYAQRRLDHPLGRGSRHVGSTFAAKR